MCIRIGSFELEVYFGTLFLKVPGVGEVWLERGASTFDKA